MPVQEPAPVGSGVKVPPTFNKRRLTLYVFDPRVSDAATHWATLPVNTYAPAAGAFGKHRPRMVTRSLRDSVAKGSAAGPTNDPCAGTGYATCWEIITLPRLEPLTMPGLF